MGSPDAIWDTVCSWPGGQGEVVGQSVSVRTLRRAKDGTDPTRNAMEDKRSRDGESAARMSASAAG